MKQDLLKLLVDLQPYELREVASTASVLGRIKKLIGGIEERVKDAISSDNPVSELRSLERRLSSNGNQSSYQHQNTLPKLDREKYDRNRAIIRDSIYEYFDTHKKAIRNDLSVYYFYDNIPKVRKEARNIIALAGYLKSIRREPDSRIRYDRVTQTYSILDKPRHKS